MLLFQKLLAVIAAAIPLPNFADASTVQVWLAQLNPVLAELIASLGKQFRAQGFVAVELPDGHVIELIRSDAGGKPCWCAPDDDVERLAAAMPAVEGVNWLQVFQKWLPILLQVLPLVLKKQDQEPIPTPEPIPNPTPVV